MQFNTFDNIQNFTPNMIPISISKEPPDWFFKNDKEDGIRYYINTNGVICGLECKELINDDLTRFDISHFNLLCQNTIILLKERLGFKKEGQIILIYNTNENIDKIKDYFKEKI